MISNARGFSGSPVQVPVTTRLLPVFKCSNPTGRSNSTTAIRLSSPVQGTFKARKARYILYVEGGYVEFERRPTLRRDRADRSLNPFKTLQRHRNFRLFWFGQTLSLVGTWMQSMAQGWLALELSNSAFLVALVASAQSFPILLLSMPAGVVVDRTDKLRLVKIAQALLAIEAAALWWFTWSGHITIAWLLALATAQRHLQRVRDPGAPVARDRARRTRGSSGRDRAQLERLQPRARRRPEHRRARSSPSSAWRGVSASTR